MSYIIIVIIDLTSRVGRLSARPSDISVPIVSSDCLAVFRDICWGVKGFEKWITVLSFNDLRRTIDGGD